MEFLKSENILLPGEDFFKSDPAHHFHSHHVSFRSRVSIPDLKFVPQFSLECKTNGSEILSVYISIADLLYFRFNGGSQSKTRQEKIVRGKAVILFLVINCALLQQCKLLEVPAATAIVGDLFLSHGSICRPRLY